MFMNDALSPQFQFSISVPIVCYYC